MNIEQIKDLKFNRLKPEERFLIDIFDGLIKVEHLKYKGEFLYMKNNYLYFYYDVKNGLFWYDYYIREVFTTKFNYNYQQNNDFIRGMVEVHLQLKGITTHAPQILRGWKVEEHLKLKGVTTKI